MVSISRRRTARRRPGWRRPARTRGGWRAPTSGTRSRRDEPARGVVVGQRVGGGGEPSGGGLVDLEGDQVDQLLVAGDVAVERRRGHPHPRGHRAERQLGAVGEQRAGGPTISRRSPRAGARAGSAARVVPGARSRTLLSKWLTAAVYTVYGLHRSLTLHLSPDVGVVMSTLGCLRGPAGAGGAARRAGRTSPRRPTASASSTRCRREASTTRAPSRPASWPPSATPSATRRSTWSPSTPARPDRRPTRSSGRGHRHRGRPPRGPPPASSPTTRRRRSRPAWSARTATPPRCSSRWPATSQDDYLANYDEVAPTLRRRTAGSTPTRRRLRGLQRRQQDHQRGPGARRDRSRCRSCCCSPC